MFIVDDMTISMTVGDTGAIKVQATGFDFEHYSESIKAIFTVKTAGGGVLMERECTFGTDGSFLIFFQNSDTEKYSAGNYVWDLRFVINPYRDSDGRIRDGDQVITPYAPQTFTLLSAVGTV